MKNLVDNLNDVINKDGFNKYLKGRNRMCIVCGEEVLDLENGTLMTSVSDQLLEIVSRTTFKTSPRSINRPHGSKNCNRYDGMFRNYISPMYPNFSQRLKDIYDVFQENFLVEEKNGLWKFVPRKV